MQSIVADRIRLAEDAEGAILSCRLRADGLDLPAEFWYRFPRELASVVSVNGDPFLPVVMLVGMKERRDIVIEADVSAELLASSRRIMGIFHAWSEQTAWLSWTWRRPRRRVRGGEVRLGRSSLAGWTRSIRS